jgi:hypothetical protein
MFEVNGSVEKAPAFRSRQAKFRAGLKNVQMDTGKQSYSAAWWR